MDSDIHLDFPLNSSGSQILSRRPKESVECGAHAWNSLGGTTRRPSDQAGPIRAHVDRAPTVLDGKPGRDHRPVCCSRGFEIVRTYEDAARAGLRLDGRLSLRSSLPTSRSGRADFDVILVYDVSRWGRFQDADESAYYEYICRRARRRCPLLRRAIRERRQRDFHDAQRLEAILMAGEYSRELSVKVFHGQCRLVELGFHQGGAAGFWAAPHAPRPERTAERRVWPAASIRASRPIASSSCPGPPEEIEIVRWMYLAFRGRRQDRIGDCQGIERTQACRPTSARPWTRGTVHQVLTNEKYVGNNVYNRFRSSSKRSACSTRADMWIRANGAFEPIISSGSVRWGPKDRS